MFLSESKLGRPRAAELVRADVRHAPLAEIEGIKQHVARNLQVNTDTFAVREVFHGRVVLGLPTATYPALTGSTYYVERMKVRPSRKTGELYTTTTDEYLNERLRLVAATNLCERRDGDFTEEGSRLLLNSDPVWVYGVILNKKTPAFLYFFYRSPKLDWTFRLTGVGAGRGKYTGALYGRRSVVADVDTTTNVVAADIGDTSGAYGGIGSAIAVNRREINITTAFPTISANLLSTTGHPIDFPATLVHVNSDGTPVVAIDAAQDDVRC